jgi:hypothetical protein
LVEQLQPANVAEFTAVDGSRHDFVQRQNEMILEYRAAPGCYKIAVRRGLGSNVFILTITDYFGNIVTGLPVQVFG